MALSIIDRFIKMISMEHEFKLSHDSQTSSFTRVMSNELLAEIVSVTLID